jgi:acetyl-CoA synthetase
MAEMTAPTNTQDWYYPAEEVVKQAYIQDYDALYQKAHQDPEGFWAEQAATLDWYKKWDKVLDESNQPFFKWFVGGKTNVALNALDRHVKTWRKNKLALIWEGEPGDSRTYSYYRLWQEVNKFGNVLRSMGVKKGDRVTIYMGRVPELIIAMLACAKVGAVHSVVYGGFSEQALADRIEDAQSRVLITQDGAWLRGQIVELKKIADEAVRRSPVVEHVVVLQRTGHDVAMENDRDYWWHDLMGLPIASTKCETEVVDAEDPLFILYTSGTTGKPKGILHTHGGYQVYISTTLKWVFDLKDEDRWWCAADPGWITGHSYIVYAPMILARRASSTRARRPTPTLTAGGRWWSITALR